MHSALRRSSSRSPLSIPGREALYRLLGIQPPCQHAKWCYTSNIDRSINNSQYRDTALEHAAEKERDLRKVIAVKDMLIKEPAATMSITALKNSKKRLGLNMNVNIFLERYPTVFETFTEDGTDADQKHPHVRLTKELLKLDEREENAHQASELDTAQRLCKLLMMSKRKKMSISLVDQLRWDLGLPRDYTNNLLPKYPEYFRVINTKAGVLVLDLVCWDEDLAMSSLEKRYKHSYKKGKPLPFLELYPDNFHFGGADARRMEHLQNMPYISPYQSSETLQINKVDVIDKWTVGVLHELLWLMVHKKAQRHNISALRECLGLPERFELWFNKMPGVFYQTCRNGVIVVFVKEAFRRAELKDPHPVVESRRAYLRLMVDGYVDFKKKIAAAEAAKKAAEMKKILEERAAVMRKSGEGEEVAAEVDASPKEEGADDGEGSDLDTEYVKEEEVWEEASEDDEEQRPRFMDERRRRRYENESSEDESDSSDDEDEDYAPRRNVKGADRQPLKTRMNERKDNDYAKQGKMGSARRDNGNKVSKGHEQVYTYEVSEEDDDDEGWETQEDSDNEGGRKKKFAGKYDSDKEEEEEEESADEDENYYSEEEQGTGKKYEKQSFSRPRGSHTSGKGANGYTSPPSFSNSRRNKGNDDRYSSSHSSARRNDYSDKSSSSGSMLKLRNLSRSRDYGINETTKKMPYNATKTAESGNFFKSRNRHQEMSGKSSYRSSSYSSQGRGGGNSSGRGRGGNFGSRSSGRGRGGGSSSGRGRGGNFGPRSSG